MTQPHKILFLAVFVAALLLLPLRGAAQSATVTDDGFLSSSSATQQVNLNGQGIVLIVAGSSAAVGSAQVGTTKTYIKFQLLSSLPPRVAGASVAKATLKLYLSPGTNPSGAIDIARYGLAAAAVNGKIYAIGGITSSGHSGTVEVYDPSTSTWSQAAPMPTVREELAAADANGLIYAIGGRNKSPNLNISFFNTVEQYSLPVTVLTFIKN